MPETLLYRTGRLCLRPFQRIYRHDINGNPPLRCSLSKSTCNYATSTKIDLPSLDKKWQKKWEDEEQLGRFVGNDESLNVLYASLKRKASNQTPSSAATDSSFVGRHIEQEHIEKGDESAGKMYILPMFPYPSGNLHLGHFRNYTIPDVLARFRRMQGYNVLLPMGWDAFGLPAENAALDRGIEPSLWTINNISKMKSQLRAMNGSWDWSRELMTCDPNYYKHTQRIFLLLHEHGLAYQAESMVNYDPVDRTVLANEQVDANGNSWRSGAKVEKKKLKQWFLRISAFRDSLLEDLDFLAQDEKWPERVLSMQRNWLGKTKGAKIKFQIMTYDNAKSSAIEVFTTRPDTLYGVQYLALAATHPIVVEQSKKDVQLRNFLENISRLPEDSKDGFLLTKVRAINPLAFNPETPDATKASLPIYVAPYVLSDYGDAAVMGVPGHDLRDNAFWKLNRGDDPIRVVVKHTTASENVPNEEVYVHQGVLTSRSGRFAGKASAEAAREIVELLKVNELAEFAETWRLRDWLISRQRYWGTPIPIIHCKSCGSVPVPIDQLPVKLPTVEGHWLRGKAGNPLEDAHEWVNTQCPNCHSPAKRDTDTMDTFVDSSWYFMRFVDPQNEETLFSADAANKLLPVDLYIGGVEHAILHLLYARFISKFLATTSYWPAGILQDIRGEPFKKLLTQGMVHGKTYTDPATGRFLKPEEVSLDTPSNPIIIATGEPANVSYEKMSKSKYNGVDPTTCIELYGADAMRAHMLFQAPASEVLEWDEGKISGILRWMTKIYEYVIRNHKLVDAASNELARKYIMTKLPTVSSFDQEKSTIWDKEIDLWLSVQRTIMSVTESFSTASSLNTVISDLMTLTNALHNSENVCDSVLCHHALSALLRMMAPITPAFAEECWSILHKSNSSIFTQSFPTLDGTIEMLQQQRRSQACAVQVNGKLKFVATIPPPPVGFDGDELSSWVTDRILETEEGRQRFIGSGGIDIRKAKRTVVVREGRTVNFVL